MQQHLLPGLLGRRCEARWIVSDRGRATIGVYPAESVAQHSAYIACVTVAITRKDGKRAVGENSVDFVSAPGEAMQLKE